MTTPAHLRKTALSQDGAEQGDVDGNRAWFVDGRPFASLESDGRAALTLTGEPASRMASELSGVDVVSGKVLVDLAAVNGMAVNYWVNQAWRQVAAPERTAGADAAASAAFEADDDFGNIGAPARRALHRAGLTSLDDVATRDRADIAALHGVGPKAVRLLAAALQERGIHW